MLIETVERKKVFELSCEDNENPKKFHDRTSFFLKTAYGWAGLEALQNLSHQNYTKFNLTLRGFKPESRNFDDCAFEACEVPE